MSVDLSVVKTKLDAMVDELISSRGKKILCTLQNPIEPAERSTLLSFYDIALLINQKFPELQFSSEYHISAMFEYADKEKNIFSLEGFSLIQTQDNQQQTLLISKVDGYTNLVAENPKLIH